jgi:macrolide transport system ATP-binding/permease protein
MTSPLIEIRDVWREFQSGDEKISILKGINLAIYPGEMVAIIGASGSGKSTLMNILGCLDRPSRGQYLVEGRDTAQMSSDEKAELRRKYFGFIFQRYHLLPDLDAISNVEMPSVYDGVDKADRRKRAGQLLERFGLAKKLDQYPSQLSGGQQQRVSIARALMNGGRIILADEPTGALDVHSGHEVMKALQQLSDEGHTVIIVTHDPKIAASARRIVEIEKGVILSDRRMESRAARASAYRKPQGPGSFSPWRAMMDSLSESFKMALKSMAAHKLRTFLTMLGIIIGIASVVSVVALGSGSQQKVLENIRSLGTNTIDIYPGGGFSDRFAGSVETLIAEDADVLRHQPYVLGATPEVSAPWSSAQYGAVSVSATTVGVSADYFRVKGIKILEGSLFNQTAIRDSEQVAIIDENARRDLFKGAAPIGRVVMVGKVPVRVIGVAEKMEGRNSLNIWMPYSTVINRMSGQATVDKITVRVKDGFGMAAAEKDISRILEQRHGALDFNMMNVDSIRKMVQKTSQTMTLLISSVALIALAVGGIGVMNIMLVSVVERTREIGVRAAVGARRSDIMTQFLIEAVLVCLAGGLAGILLSLGVGRLFAVFSNEFRLIYSVDSMLAAFACSTLIGVVFGFFPARRAASLDPVEALSRG